MSVSADILHSWRDPRGVVRGLLAHGTREDRALAYLMTACALGFLAQWPRLVRQAQIDDTVPLAALMGGALMGWLFIAPLLLYGLAALLRLVMLALRRPVGWYAARLALFWSMLATSPLWLLHGLVAGLAGPGLPSLVVGGAALVAFFWQLGSALATAALEAPAARA